MFASGALSGTSRFRPRRAFAHLPLITLGCGELLTEYPGITEALLRTFCLVMVVLSSSKPARRMLRYETWHLLHLNAYLGVGGVLLHQLWNGQAFLISTAATVYW